ncbi:general secretion pathway protein C [Ectothiorhodospira magna]|uniref:General secretion pathway protein C n=1 Tax=Ectothiorhodospira magna TaxID=867345 RepID=A0A1H9D4X9_9GAMM|nr:type II secretion system protein GspC [Ectothiorhodospira magna]SEQ08441.1 general secretion pathway protein C [Ectothiorhodospira magna]
MLTFSRSIFLSGIPPHPAVVARLGQGLMLMLVVLLAWSLAQLTWAVLVPATSPSMPVAMQVPGERFPATAPPADPGQRLASVADLHLFGQAQALPQTPAVPAQAPETRLQLSLKGVVTTPDPAQGVALIADAQDNERHYRVGAQLPGGARLEQIFADRVILSRGGSFEMLRLPRETLETTAVVPVRPIAPTIARGASQRDETLASTLAERRAIWLQEPARFMDSIRARPVMVQGEIRGFTVSPRRDPALFRQAGLRPGDVVTGINGTPVSAITDPQALLTQLAQATEIRLDLERQGRTLSLTLPVGP